MSRGSGRGSRWALRRPFGISAVRTIVPPSAMPLMPAGVEGLRPRLSLGPAPFGIGAVRMLPAAGDRQGPFGAAIRQVGGMAKPCAPVPKARRPVISRV